MNTLHSTHTMINAHTHQSLASLLLTRGCEPTERLTQSSPILLPTPLFTPSFPLVSRGCGTRSGFIPVPAVGMGMGTVLEVGAVSLEALSVLTVELVEVGSAGSTTLGVEIDGLTAVLVPVFVCVHACAWVDMGLCVNSNPRS